MNESVWIIDFGNTRQKLAEFVDGDFVQAWVNDDALERAQLAQQNQQLPGDIFVACTGTMSEEWEQMLGFLKQDESKNCRVFQVSNAHELPFQVEYESRATLGLDRLANAAGAAAVDDESDWLIIDMGTCITADLVSNKAFIGGSISPGIDLRLRSMYAGTAQLPYVENWRDIALEGVAIHLGHNTRSALIAGAIGGVQSELIQRIHAFSKEYPGMKVALTGGDAKYLQLHEDFTIFADPNLTLKGYFELYKRLIKQN